jgi:PIN domain nuclease of toxin-antitoxin system
MGCRLMVVLDASALLAAILFEPGSARVRELPRPVISAVNLAEVAARLQRDIDDAAVIHALATLDLTVIAVDREQAMVAGLLGEQTRSAGLSLGDRFCLALARQLGVAALTADRAWLRVADVVGVDVQLIR